jgi:hypothetical protein
MSTRNLQEKVLEPEYAVSIAYLVFLISVFLAYTIPVTQTYLLGSFKTAPTLFAYLLSLIGILFFIVSVRLGKKLEIKSKSPVLVGIFLTTSAVVYLTLDINVVLAILIGGGYPLLLFYLTTQKDLQRLTRIVFIMALLSALSILVRGIPILSASARAETAMSTSRALFHGFGVFSGTLLISFYDKNKAIIAIVLLATAGILSGFKSDAIAIILSASIAGLLLKKISLKTVGGGVLSIGIILTGVSTFIALVAHGVWNIPPYLYPFYRFGFTFSVFSKIVDISIPFGALKGQAIINTTQEIVSTSVLGYSEPHIITSTLFGPLTLDFGLLGTLLTAILIGVYLGLMKKGTPFRTALYAMALTHILVLIEVGLQLSSIMFLLSMLYLSMGELTLET